MTDTIIINGITLQTAWIENYGPCMNGCGKTRDAITARGVVVEWICPGCGRRPNEQGVRQLERQTQKARDDDEKAARRRNERAAKRAEKRPAPKPEPPPPPPAETVIDRLRKAQKDEPPSRKLSAHYVISGRGWLAVMRGPSGQAVTAWLINKDGSVAEYETRKRRWLEASRHDMPRAIQKVYRKLERQMT